MEYKRMHCHNEIEAEVRLAEPGYIGMDILVKWFNDHYSTSKHLLVLYSIAKGMKAMKIGEIGVGRSSYALALAAKENGGKFYMCDIRDYRNLLTTEMSADIDFTVGRAKDMYKKVGGNFDFIFIDYLSNTQLDVHDAYKELKRALVNLKPNGIIAVHDGINSKYKCGSAIKFLPELLFKSMEFNFWIETLTLPYNNGLTIISKRSTKLNIKDDPFAGKKENTDTKHR